MDKRCWIVDLHNCRIVPYKGNKPTRTSLFPNCIQVALPRGLSDHCSTLLTIDQEHWGPKPLRMLKCWEDIPGYGDFVKESW